MVLTYVVQPTAPSCSCPRTVNGQWLQAQRSPQRCTPALQTCTLASVSCMRNKQGRFHTRPSSRSRWWCMQRPHCLAQSGCQAGTGPEEQPSNSPSGPCLSVYAGLGWWHMQHVTYLQQRETGSEGSGVHATVARRMLCSMCSCPSQKKPACTCRECSTSLQEAPCAALWAVLNASLQLRSVAPVLAGCNL